MTIDSDRAITNAAGPAPMPTDDWQSRGVCREVDPELWFPEKGGSTREAKKMCRRCPVSAECLAYGLANEEKFGIWGGYTARELRSGKAIPLEPIEPTGDSILREIGMLPGGRATPVSPAPPKPRPVPKPKPKAPEESAVMTTPTPTPSVRDTSQDVYVDAIAVADMFVDRTYQRDLDQGRARKMGANWDRRLVGVLDVSDRGPGHLPRRYAVINGQHRWAAASHAGAATHLAANVHTGLTVAEEAALFRDIDRSTKKLTTWDRWKARRATGDVTVCGIDTLAGQYGLKVEQRAGYFLVCVSALERCYNVDPHFLARTLELVTDVWPDDPHGLKAGVIQGLFEIVRSDELEQDRLADALLGVTPQQLHARAVEARKIHDGQFWACMVRVIIDVYNRAGRGKVDPDRVLAA